MAFQVRRGRDCPHSWHYTSFERMMHFTPRCALCGKWTHVVFLHRKYREPNRGGRLRISSYPPKFTIRETLRYIKEHGLFSYFYLPEEVEPEVVPPHRKVEELGVEPEPKLYSRQIRWAGAEVSVVVGYENFEACRGVVKAHEPVPAPKKKSGNRKNMDDFNRYYVVDRHEGYRRLMLAGLNTETRYGEVLYMPEKACCHKRKMVQREDGTWVLYSDLLQEGQ